MWSSRIKTNLWISFKIWISCICIITRSNWTHHKRCTRFSNVVKYNNGYRAKDFTNLKELYRKSRTEAFGEEVKRRIILGTYVLSSGYYDAYYKKAQKVRTFVKKQFDENFKKYDVLLTPVAPTTAFEIGSKSNNPIEMYLADICTVSINIASVPAISIPCGVDKNGMPVGMQLIGDRFSEAKILNAAYTFEQKIQFKQNHKPEFKK